MIRIENILVTLEIFLNQVKTLMKNFIPRKNLQNCLF